jgi:hypothetical protein
MDERVLDLNLVVAIEVANRRVIDAQWQHEAGREPRQHTELRG